MMLLQDDTFQGNPFTSPGAYCFTRKHLHLKEVRKGTEIWQIKKWVNEAGELINNSETYKKHAYFKTGKQLSSVFLSFIHILYTRGEIIFADNNCLRKFIHLS